MLNIFSILAAAGSVIWQNKRLLILMIGLSALLAGAFWAYLGPAQAAGVSTIGRMAFGLLLLLAYAATIIIVGNNTSEYGDRDRIQIPEIQPILLSILFTLVIGALILLVFTVSNFRIAYIIIPIILWAYLQFSTLAFVQDNDGLKDGAVAGLEFLDPTVEAQTFVPLLIILIVNFVPPWLLYSLNPIVAAIFFGVLTVFCQAAVSILRELKDA